MVQLNSLVAFLLTTVALFLATAFISLQFVNISNVKSFCKDFSAELELETSNVILEQGKGKLVRGNLTNTGFENEFSLSSEGPSWVVVRPQILSLNKGEKESVFVYMSPDFGVKGVYTVKIIADDTCVHLEKSVKARVA